MFRNKNTYVLNISDFELLLEDDNEKILKRIELDEDVLNSEEIDDVQLKYLINKILNGVDIRNNILARYDSSKNIFRSDEIENLSESEVKSYLEYNIDDYMPFDRSNLIIREEYKNPYLYIFAMRKSIVNLVGTYLKELGYKKIYFTNHLAEIISFNNANCALYINAFKKYFEYVFFSENNVSNYKFVPLDYSIETFKNLDEIYKYLDILTKNILKKIETNAFDIDECKKYITGDWNIAGYWKNNFETNHNLNFEYLSFDIGSYF